MTKEISSTMPPVTDGCAPRRSADTRIPEYGVGIDAGGTFTDAVLVHLPSGRVLNSHKAPTTPLAPDTGIRQALSGLPKDRLAEADFVSLTTTFATNAIVEGRGCRAGLILIGYDRDHPGLKGMSPVMHLPGGHDTWGAEKEPLATDRLAERLSEFCGDLDAVAISGFFSIRNPAHENRVARELQQCTRLPVICGHSLSSRLGGIERATTAWWNARLVPLISRLIESTRTVIAEFGLAVPLMIVKGDGTLLSAAEARRRPVETLLSGPAASLIGARHLSGLEDALVVDMGGTTTDMAALTGGRVEVAAEGARVGPWQTHVEAARVRTVGLGGDSLFRSPDATLDRLSVGPRRVEPLCTLAERFPAVVETLALIDRKNHKRFPFAVDPCTFYRLARAVDDGADRRLEGFAETPVNEYLLLSGKSPSLMQWDLEKWETAGHLLRSALTPTDLLVAAGSLSFGSRDAATLGLSIFARRLKVEPARLAEAMVRAVEKKICSTAATYLAGPDAEAVNALCPYWFDGNGRKNGRGIGLRHRLTLTHPVIGTGAPAAAWLPGAFGRMHTRCRLPDAYSVGTAVGAVVGAVGFTLTAEIRPAASGRCVLYLPVARRDFDDMDAAVREGRSLLESLARDRMRKNRVAQPVLTFSEHRKAVDTPFGEVYMATELRLRATGRIQV